jgi:hypothetical protein
MKPMRKVEHDGQLWCSVGDGAKHLGTNAQKIRALMGSGELRYTQLRLNGRLYVSVNDLARLRYPDSPIEVKPSNPSPS